MYTNISTREVESIIKEILDNGNITSEQKKHEIITLLNTILEQNYVQLNNQFYKQDQGLAVGVPTSAVLAETFIQNLEHTNSSKF
jgi:hypothetical protein